MKLYTLTNEYAVIILDGQLVKCEYFASTNGRYMIIVEGQGVISLDSIA